MPLTLEQLNAAPQAEFTALLDGTYEHSPWVAEAAWPKRPFASLAALKLALVQALRARAVRVGEVGHCQLAELGIAGVGVLRELLGPVPHQVAELRRMAELVVQANLGNAVDVAQALGELEVGRVVQPALEGGDDLGLAQPQAARAAHREDERKAELGVVVGVELLDARELLGRALGEAGLALLVRRLRRQRLADHGLAGELGVGADQPHLRLAAGLLHHPGQCQLQLHQAGERALCGGALGDPGRMLVSAVQEGDELLRRGGVDLLEGQHRVTPR